MKWVFFFLLYSSHLFAQSIFQANGEQLVVGCLDKIKEKFSMENIEWTLSPAMGPSDQVINIYKFKNLSLQKWGQSALLEVASLDSTVLFLLEPSLKACTFIKIKDEKASENHGKDNNPLIFTDRDLERILKLEKKGIIFTWSPHMPYSIGNLAIIEKFAKENSIYLKILMDPYASDGEIQRVQKKFQITKMMTKKNMSTLLKEKGALLHFPNFIFFQNGEFIKTQLLGAKSEKTLSLVLKKIFITKDK